MHIPISAIVGAKQEWDHTWSVLHFAQEESGVQRGKGTSPESPMLAADVAPGQCPLGFTSLPTPFLCPRLLYQALPVLGEVAPREENELDLLFFPINQRSIFHFFCIDICNYPNFHGREKNDMIKQKTLLWNFPT